jgi:hypothetical protein
MVRLGGIAGVLAALSIACGEEAATEEGSVGRQSTRSAVVAEPQGEPAATTVPEDPADSGIRRDLDLALAQDPDLREREISFVVTNGDVSVAGTVKTETERRKINEIAMNIGGVKSVANALRVEGEE